MANYSCEACGDLRNDAPNVIVNGITATEEASLANNTGLNPSSGNNDCTDLNNLNDCLIGNLEQDIESYDVCEWKPFMKKFLPNSWTVNKGVISAVCGLWTNLKSILDNIDDIWDFIKNLCNMVETVITPTGAQYGVFPRNSAITQIGTITTKNSRPALIDAHITDVVDADKYTGVGIRWGSIKANNCNTGAEITRQYWKPYIWGYKLNKDIEFGDPLWVATKSEFMAATGASEAFWQQYTLHNWTWTEFRIMDGADRGKLVWVRMQVGDAGYSNNYMVMTYRGTSYPNAVPNYDALVQEGDSNEIQWV